MRSSASRGTHRGQQVAGNDGRPSGWVASKPSDAPNVPVLLRGTVVAVFVLPANMVLKPLGATGYVALVLADLMLALWALSSVFGLHRPVRMRFPARVGVGALWIATCLAYLGMASVATTAAGRASADRWLLTLAGMTAITLVTAECVRTTQHAMQLVRVLVGGATFCAVVAVIQFLTHADPLNVVRSAMIGFVDNGGNTTFQPRSNLVRVAGSTFTPIELGVVSSLVLPFAIWRAIFDGAKKWWHWSQTALIGFAAISSVSRSAILSLLIVAVVSVPFLPIAARKWAVLVIPAAIVLVFASVPGLVATLTGSFTAGTTDPSLTTRLNNYPRVEALVTAHPISGTGPGTYLPANALQILDNQYLHTAVEMGLVGVAALGLWFALPAISSLIAARHAGSADLRSLCGAVAAAGLVGLVSSATFDSLSFPVFVIIWPVVTGMSGACWIIAKGRNQRTRPSNQSSITGQTEGAEWIR